MGWREDAQQLGALPAKTTTTNAATKSLTSSDWRTDAQNLGFDVTPTPPQPQPKQPGILGQTANLINTGYEKYTQLPVIKQAGQVVGGAAGVLGGLIGGTVGAVGGVAKETYDAATGKGFNVGDIVKSTVDTAKDTANFGYQAGAAAAPAAPLGALGELGLLGRIGAGALAYGQGYQGIKDVQQGIKEKDPALALQGGLSLGTAALGAKGLIKDTPIRVAENIKQGVEKSRVNAPKVYGDILRPSKTELKNIEIRQGKDVTDAYNLMAENKVIPKKGENNKLSTLDEANRLREEMTPVSDKLGTLLASRPDIKFNLTQIGQKAVKEIDTMKISATEKLERTKDVIDFMEAEKKYHGNIVDGTTVNNIKQGLWKLGYNLMKPTANKTARKLGYIIKDQIQTKYNDPAIQELNGKTGTLMTAISLLENAHGRVIDGGMLTKKLAGIAGGIAGAPIPFVGPIAGYFAGQKVQEFLSNPERKAASIINKYDKRPVLGKILKFERAKDLSPENRAIETKAFDYINKNEDKILRDNANKYGKIVNTDNFRPEFSKVGYDGSNSAAVQEPSSYLSKKAYTNGLKSPGEYAILYAGGSGSGKTSAIKKISLLKKFTDNSAVILDGNLSTYSSAIKKINEATEAGKQSPIIYVYRDPVQSFVDGVVRRMNNNPDEMGRVVPTKVVAENHVGSWETIQKLDKEGFKIKFIDNSNGVDKAKLVPINELKNKIKYPTNLVEILNNEAKKLYDQGTITKQQYKAYVK